MPIYQSAPLTGNDLKSYLIRLTPFIQHLPDDVVGGSDASQVAPRLLTLHYEGQSTATDLPTDQKGKLRGFFRDRKMARIVLQDAEIGDVVVFASISPYEYLMRLQKAGAAQAAVPSPWAAPTLAQQAVPEAAIEKWALREVRTEQQKFRKAIAQRDGLQCAITGCAIAEVLDAAHLRARAQGGADHPDNGVILRTDLHRLYDSGQLQVDWNSGKVSLTTAHARREYGQYEGRRLQTRARLAMA